MLGVDYNMSKNKIKIALIIIAIVCVLLLCCLAFYHILFSVHKGIIDEGRNYEPYSVVSKDGEFLLKTKKVVDETGTYATFIIETVDEKEILFECPEKYRTYDLKSIEWDSLNIIVDSSDVGTITYKFVNNTWEKLDTTKFIQH
jgi:hypothetical protein